MADSVLHLPQSIVTARDLTRVYREEKSEARILDGVTFQILRGERIALFGRSGSGKTTLLNLIGLIDSPTSGELAIGNHPVRSLSESDKASIRARHIGFIFQTFNLIPTLTAYENVEYGLLNCPLSHRERRQRVLESLSDVGLSDFINRRPQVLSGGQRQRVAIARAIAKKPLLILADEPTANLDTENSKVILNHLSTLSEKLNVTLLIASHDPLVLGATREHWMVTDGHLEVKRAA